MTGPEPGHAPVLGLLVNPIAGIGGRVGLKGSDGPETVRRALALGASPAAGGRAETAVRHLLARWPAAAEPPVVLAAPLVMGEAAAAAAGARPRVIGSIDPGATTAADTVRLAKDMAERGIHLLLFAGGDGTARDIHDALRDLPVPVLGIPAGVKIHSAVFATGPATAGEVAARFLALPSGRRRTEDREVLDLDEDAYRRGEISPRLWGMLQVPAERRGVQASKAPSAPSEAAAAAAIADEIADRASTGDRYILGPGSTMRTIAERLGVAKTLVGVDVVVVVAPGEAALVATDAGEAAAAAAIADEIADRASTGDRYILGPGSTVRTIAERLGVAKTLVGVDAVEVVAPGEAALVATDAGEAELRPFAEAGDCRIVVTPIGGQGFVFGRGNQQIGPPVIREVVRRAGRSGIIVVATPGKLAALGTRPLLIDTGDPGLDRELAGHVQVITGRGERTIARVAAA